MGIKADEECKKGDICNIRFDIMLEQSSTKDDLTISLWKNHNDRFAVSRYNKKGRNKKENWHDVLHYGENKNEAEARKEYERQCEEYGVSPYPEAETYYRSKGLFKSFNRTQ